MQHASIFVLMVLLLRSSISMDIRVGFLSPTVSDGAKSIAGQWASSFLMAIDEINNSTLITPHKIIPVVLGTNYDIVLTLGQSLKIHDEGVSVLCGPYASSESIPSAALLQYFSLPQISYGSTNPSLSNRERFPYFLRLVPPEQVQARAIIAYIKHFGWKQVVGLYAQESYATAAMEEFTKRLAIDAPDVQIVSIESFASGIKDVSFQLSNLNRQEVRCIVFFSLNEDCLTVWKEAKKQHLLEDHVWLSGDGVTNFDPNALTKVGLSPSDLVGLVATAPYAGIGSRYEDFANKIKSLDPEQYDGVHLPIDALSSYTYDCAYTVAHSLNRVIPAGQISNGTFIRDDLTRNTGFEGVTGTIKFDSVGDRIGSYNLLNWQGSHWVSVSFWNGSDVVINQSLIWGDGSHNIPGDFKITYVWVKWTEPLGIAITAITTFVILILITTIFIVVHFRDYHVIKRANVYTLVLMMFGFSIVCCSIYFAIGEPSRFKCNARPWLGFLGFLIGYMPMVATTWKLYEVWQSAFTKFKKVNVPHHRLIIYCLPLTLVQLIILIVWVVVDPETPVFIGTSVIQVKCSSSNIIYETLSFIYCSLFILASAILAYLSRNVPDEFGEPIWVNLATYNIVVCAAVGIPATYMSGNVETSFIISSVAILLPVLAFWGIMFTPKLKRVLNGEGDKRDTPKVSSGPHHSNVSSP